jgi:hypothetical protein
MMCEEEWPEDATDSEAFYEYMSDFTSETTAETFADPQFQICILTMPKPVTAPEASFVALCRPNGGTGAGGSSSSKTRYFTVERTAEPSLYCFCEWTPEGKHLNLAQVGVLSKAAFLQRIRERLGREADPAEPVASADLAAGRLIGMQVSFGYSVQTEDAGAVGAILGKWAGTEPLRPSEGMGTQEIHFDSYWLSLYGFLDSQSNGPIAMVITGSMPGDVALVRPKLEALRDLFVAAGLPVGRAEYEGCDAEGNSITEEFRLA